MSVAAVMAKKGFILEDRAVESMSEPLSSPIQRPRQRRTLRFHRREADPEGHRIVATPGNYGILSRRSRFGGLGCRLLGKAPREDSLRGSTNSGG